MNRTKLAVLSVAACLLTFSAAVSMSTQQAGAPQASSDPIIYLDQGWSQDDRDWYYHFSQGSAVLSYDIYLNLEVAGSQDLLRSGARYGLLPGPVNPYNPDGLPIGISKTTVATPIKGWPAGDYAGVTCAACHEGRAERTRASAFVFTVGIRIRSICRLSLGVSTMRCKRR